MKRRTVLVTGGGRGLGRAISTAFGTCGDRVAVFYRADEASALAVRQEIEERAAGPCFSRRQDPRR
jgi:3-oxoacyl-[acyl-carrier protein] reductase